MQWSDESEWELWLTMSDKCSDSKNSCTKINNKEQYCVVASQCSSVPSIPPTYLRWASCVAPCNQVPSRCWGSPSSDRQDHEQNSSKRLRGEQAGEQAGGERKVVRVVILIVMIPRQAGDVSVSPSVSQLVSQSVLIFHWNNNSIVTSAIRRWWTEMAISNSSRVLSHSLSYLSALTPWTRPTNWSSPTTLLASTRWPRTSPWMLIEAKVSWISWRNVREKGARPYW